MLKQTEAELFGDEQLVRNVSYTGKSAIEIRIKSDEETNSKIATRGSGKISRQRLLNRTFLSGITKNAVNDITGSCTGNDSFCNQKTKLFVDWMLEKFEPVTFELVDDAKGNKVLRHKLINYATLDPTSYKEILKSAPSFDINATRSTTTNGSGTDGSKSGASGDQGDNGAKNDSGNNSDSTTTKAALDTIIKDSIHWESNGVEPIPTKVDLYILDELTLNVAASAKWYQNTPVKNSTATYVISLVYPNVGFYNGEVQTVKEIQEKERLEAKCKNGQIAVPFKVSNLAKPKGGKFSKQNTRFDDYDSSRKCRNSFSGHWEASPGHFILLNGKSHSATQAYKKGRRSFNYEYVPHAGNVNDEDGNPQAIKKFTFWGHGNGDSGTTDDRCGGTVVFYGQQYPEVCVPYLVDGYID